MWIHESWAVKILFLKSFLFIFMYKQQFYHLHRIYTFDLFHKLSPFYERASIFSYIFQFVFKFTMVDLDLWESVSASIVSTHPLKNKENTGPASEPSTKHKPHAQTLFMQNKSKVALRYEYKSEGLGYVEMGEPNTRPKERHSACVFECIGIYIYFGLSVVVHMCDWICACDLSDPKGLKLLDILM